jgi:tRNA pseudouridine55 synthase
MEHPVDGHYPTSHITPELVQQVLPRFIGNIQQVPPAYSACKIGGDRAYQLKRQGEEVQLAPKTVRVDELELLWFDPEKMQMQIRVVCGKGTYIRSLGRDIGLALNSGAYLTQLTRTRVGGVRIEDCIALEELPQWLDRVLGS